MKFCIDSFLNVASLGSPNKWLTLQKVHMNYICLDVTLITIASFE